MTNNDLIKIYKKLTDKRINGIKDFKIACHEGLNSLKINYINVDISLQIQIIYEDEIYEISEKAMKVLDSIPKLNGYKINFEKIFNDNYSFQKIKYQESQFEHKLVTYRDFLKKSAILRISLFHFKLDELQQYMEEIDFKEDFYIEFEQIMHIRNFKKVRREWKLIELNNAINYEDNLYNDDESEWDF